MDATVWAIKHFEAYLVGKHFVFSMYHNPLETLGKDHTQTFKRLQLAMIDLNLEIAFKKGS